MKILWFILLIAITFSAAAVGAAFRPGEWFLQLEKPPLNPPGWIFGPVWTVLYLCIAVAAWKVLVKRKTEGRSTRAALSLFFVQLGLNAIWSWLFFGLHRIDLALIDILILDVLVILTLRAFWNIHRPAGMLLIPYLLWISFATYLNAAFLWLNR